MSLLGKAYWRSVATIGGYRSARVLLDSIWDWTHSRQSFIVVSCERNAGRDALTCLQSVYAQDYPHRFVRHLFIDDASTDGTDALVRGWLATHRNHRVEYIRNESQQGGTANTIKALRMALPGEIVLEVNGDDWLADGGVVRYLNSVFHNPDVWMTYNSFRYVDNRGHNLCVPIPESVMRGNTHREHEEFFGRHLHAFRKELFDHIDLRAMIDPATGEYWASADDQALYLCMFELAGCHVRHLDRILYVYNLRPYSHEMWDAEAGRERVARIRRMPPFAPLAQLVEGAARSGRETHVAPNQVADGGQPSQTASGGRALGELCDRPSPRSPMLTCVVCTRNRKRYLREAIMSLIAQDADPMHFEILIVDNGSVDGTSSMIASEFGGYAHVRVMNEPVTGLSRARNTGWRAAQGQYVAFLDDDAVATTHWVTSLLAAFSAVEPRLGCVGGPIDLLWEHDVPEWVPFDFHGLLGFWNLGGSPRTLPHEYLAGGNMAIPKTVLEQVGGFDVRLGRSRWGLLSNEEILLEQRIRASGLCCYYVPDARVKHWAHASRLHPRWFLKRMFWQGVSNAVMDLALTPRPFRQRALIAVRRVYVSGFRLRHAARLLVTFPMKRKICQNGIAMESLGLLAGYMFAPRQ